ncbi:mechanosensitive ion channel [Citrobacter freundii complex sp. 2023EL-00966]|uniref:mechanosensitive ion channel domain-containing protein n=1 Tax=Citrobacter freundii complex sp. 2023EL-00966 TaxID=3076118 RepID=UPI002893CBB7|nr:mechanosensitive ion channel domain-containing protein [Citrobacter freundii complex sp. 2023EL-00966]MDT3751868.1 mechanosensitive ion channel [Citrobacter freundii complex sp. 2023EL-00966]
MIRVADNEGLVSEIGMLATKIITRENYVVTVPNAVVVSGKITNLSAQSTNGGVNLTVGVTIGYDTPWRQVHAMLELATKRAKGIDLSVSYLHMQSSHVQSPSIYQGSYDNPYLWFASVNYSYQF